MKAVYFLSECHFPRVYAPDEQAVIARLLGESPPLVTPEHYRAGKRAWPGVEMIFGGWGIVRFDEEFLARFPDLKIVFYAAGTISDLATDAFWQSGRRITTAVSANSVPVAEFALAEILFSLKHGWRHLADIRKRKAFPRWIDLAPPGAFGSTVGLLSLGNIARRLVDLLRPFDLDLVAYDPAVDPEAARRLGVRLLSLDEVFRLSMVVSCHTPWLPETERMIRGRHFEQMPQGATFLNTARGAVVAEDEMIAVLRSRPDLTAVLDVTHPEPPDPDSPLYELENVVLTPHLAGSLGGECGRMGRLMTKELGRHLAGRALECEVPAPAEALGV